MVKLTVVSLIIALLVACSLRTRGPVDQRINSLKTIAVAEARFAPDIEVDIVTGKAGGAARGAGRGAAGGLAGAIYATDGIAILIAPVIAIAGGVAGGVTGAVVSEPYSVARNSKPLIEEALNTTAIQSLLRGEVLNHIQALTGRPAIALQGQGPVSPDEIVDYSVLLDSEVDGVLETAITRVASERANWGTAFALAIEATARLVRLSDGAVLFDRDYRILSNNRTLADWASDDGRLVKQAYAAILREISWNIVDHAYPQQRKFRKEIGAYCPNADLGHTDAQLRIGSILYHGMYGRSADPVGAWLWFSLAAEHGDELGKRAVEMVTAELTPEQLEDARRRLRHWQPGRCMQDFGLAR